MFDDDDFESQLRHITILLQKKKKRNDSNAILRTHMCTCLIICFYEG